MIVDRYRTKTPISTRDRKYLGDVIESQSYSFVPRDDNDIHRDDIHKTEAH